MSKETLKKALELGIENAESLTTPELKVSETDEDVFAKELNLQARQTEMLAILSDYLGISDIDKLTKEEVKALLDKKATAEALNIEVILDEEEGKTEEIIVVNGNDYVFSKDAPAAFRYMGQHRTQQEWFEDPVAVELMVAGNLSFLILKK
jgi:hypothetical protein